MLRTVILSLCLACGSACSKNKSETSYLDDTSPFQDQNPPLPRPGSSNDDLLPIPIASTSPSRDSFDPSSDPSAALECPNTSDWSKFDAFAAPCSHAWTTDAKKLPIPPEWQPCSPADGIPSGTCKKLKRARRLKTFYVGAKSAKEMQIGFVEPCAADQIVLADIDGPTRFAMRRAENTQFPATCQMKLLALDKGQWLAAIGGHEIPSTFNTSGYSTGGAFIGGTIGAAPTVLFSQTSDPFHVATSQGTILQDGWSADGKRRQWNGKTFDKPARLGLSRLTKHLWLDEKNGFYEQSGAKRPKLDPDPKWLLEVPPGHTFVGVQIHDKQIVWQEQSGKTCALWAGEINGQELLTRPRRIAEIPCTSPSSNIWGFRSPSASFAPNPTFALGCNAVLLGHDTHLALLTLANGASRTLRVKGRPAALNCQEAFVERAGNLLRIDLMVFGPAKAPAIPPIEFPVTKK